MRREENGTSCPTAAEGLPASDRRTNLVVFEHRQLDLLPLVLVLLWSGVRLLLPLFSTTTKSEHKVQRRLLRQTHETTF